MLIFDIETGPLPDEDLLRLLPEFDESQFVVGEFDPASVKTGNTKDPSKIAEKVDQARAEHARLAATADTRREIARAQHFEDFKGKAALSARTGQVLAVGFFSPANQATAILHGPESNILEQFWAKVEDCRRTGRRLVGHNIAGFDLPFLIRRSWILQIDVPNGLFVNGRWLNEKLFCDTMQTWACGTRDWVSLDDCARTFACGGKPEDVTGADFARLWNGKPEERERATEYLLNDVRMTGGVAASMGILN